MNGEPQQQITEDAPIPPKNQKNSSLSISIFASAILLAVAWIYTAGLKSLNNENGTASVLTSSQSVSALEEAVLPQKGVVLPVRWGDLGIKLTSTGVIDRQAFDALYEGRGGLTNDERKLLETNNSEPLTITNENSGFLLNLFWALGLGTKNNILEKGPMTDPRYGGAGNFASTGGWTLATGGAMSHYSQHPFITLTGEQQAMVERVSKNIYRPCCNNATYFPDCNHGMAMLGLLELMASQGVSETEMYATALRVNAYWFPDTYFTIATYMKNKGVDWKNVNPKEMLGAAYSSATGYANIASQVVRPGEQRGGNGCGVDAGAPAPAPVSSPHAQPGCGT